MHHFRLKHRDGRLIALMGGVFFALAVLVFTASFWERQPASRPVLSASTQSLTANPDCDPGSRACRAVDGHRQVTLRFGTAVAPMERFFVNVMLEGIVAQTVGIEFRMVGMEMGVNRFDLASDGGSVWRGEAILPICWTGRREWNAIVTIRSGDVGIQASFAFAVVS